MQPNSTWVLAFAALVFGVTGASIGAAPPTANDAPVCHWEFDGTLEDQAGQSADKLSARDGTARFVDASELPGVSGKAVALGVQAGDAQYLVAPVSDDIHLGSSYTIEAWIQPTQLGTWNRLVLEWAGPPNYAYHLAIHQGLASLCHNQANGEYLFAEGGRLAVGRWHHLAAVARRNDNEPAQSTLTVYLDGRPVGTAPFDGTIRTVAAEGLGIGDSAGAPSASCRYRGYIDEVTMWNRALAAEEIAAHYAKRADLLRELERVRWKLEMENRAEIFTRLQRHGVEEIVFAERAPGRDPAGHYYANFGYSCIDPTYWIHGADGGRLCKLNLRTGELTALVDDPEGAVRDPQVHYDGEKILFSYRKGGTHSYNLYEIQSDGSGLRQITSGAWDDIEPTYLPDGDIMFCSSRSKRYIGCWLAHTATLHRCDPSGQDIRMVSSGSFTENTPAVLHDGRVLYTRWEYVNRDAVSFHHLWTVNPDGTGQMVYFGNMHLGGVFIDARPIPGTSDVLLTNSPGHGRNEHAGFVAVLSSKSGPDAGSALKNITASIGFRDPYPISADAFLVAKGNEILLMDGEGGAEVLYTAPSMVHEPRPILRQPREQIISPKADLAETTGTLVLRDIYTGRNTDGITGGTIRKLLVLEDLPKPANFHGGGSQPIGHGVTSTLKRILGTVPVESDGSACFEVPAMRSLYFVALDENDRSVKQMRSFVTVQPGETVGCVGCHESRTQTPGTADRRDLQALVRAPSSIQPIEDVPAIPDFPRDIQPILDRHCVTCHNYDKRDGGVVLVGDHGPVFSHSFYELLLHWQVKDTHDEPRHGTGRQPGNDRPYATYSSASPLMEKTDVQHYEVKLTDREETMVRLWIDAGAQYPGTYAAYGTGQIGGCWGNNRPVREMADDWPSTAAAVEVIERRCGSCHAKDQLPRHVTAQIPLDSWGDMLSWTRPLSRYSRHRLYNLSQPDKSLVLLAALSHEAGGYAEGEPASSDTSQPVAEDRSQPPKPIVHPVVFDDSDDPDYQKILSHIEAAKARLEEIKRFDMPDFKPNEHYVREMKRYGVLAESFDLSRDPIDVYATDDAYWRSMWHRPRH